MTKSEETKVTAWFKDTFWPNYPASYCRGGKGSRAKAMIAMLKYNPDDEEMERIVNNLKAQVRADKGKTDRVYWSIGLTYVNNRMWDDEIESVMEKKQAAQLNVCCIEGCHNEVHGPMYKHCSTHVENAHSDLLAVAFRKTGIKYGSPDFVNECRKACRISMNKLTGKMNDIK